MHATITNIWTAGIGILILGSVVGCSALSAPGATTENQTILAACLPHKQVAADDRPFTDLA